MKFRVKLLHVVLLTYGLHQSVFADQIKDDIFNCNQQIKKGNLEKALDISSALIKQDSKLADAWLCQGKAFMQKSDLAQAEFALKKSSDLQNSETDKMVALGLLGNVEMMQDKAQDALSHYQQAYDLSIKNNVKAYQRVSLNLLGDANSKLSQWASAISNYEGALKLSNNDSERSDVYARMSAMFEASNDLTSAIQYQVKRLISIQHYGNLDEIADTHLELGRLYALNKEYNQAYKSVNKVLADATQQDSPYWRALSHIQLARIDIATGANESATQHFHEAEKLSQQINDESLTAELKSLEQSVQH
jgi:tetratricopeptide (TPR) repeat protein